MKIAIIGASGFIGSNLINELLKETKHELVAISRNNHKLPENERLVKMEVDVFDNNAINTSLQNVDVVYYLVHMMAQKKIDYAVAEKQVAEIVGEACKSNGVKKIIYLGGLGSDLDKLSKHLKSRHRTGSILNKYVPTIEFRASMVIGDGSISYEIIKNLVHKLPVLTVPKWSSTLTQPIGLHDVLKYLVAALDLPDKPEVIEIGGPDKMSYKDLMNLYAKFSGRKIYIIDLPIIPVAISAWWLNLFTPRRQAKVGRAMVESLANEMVVNDNKADTLFPKLHPRKVEEFFK